MGKDKKFEKVLEDENSQEETSNKSNSKEDNLEKILVKNSNDENMENEIEDENLENEIEDENLENEIEELESGNLEESLNESGDISNNPQENQYIPNRPTYISEENKTENREVNYETSRGGDLYSGEISGSEAYSTTAGTQYSQNSEDTAYSGNIGKEINNPDRLKSFEEKSSLEKKSMSSFGKSSLIQTDEQKYI